MCMQIFLPVEEAVQQVVRPMLCLILFITWWTPVTKFHQLDMKISLSNFEPPVLLCIKTKFDDQILVGKRLTRSTTSTFLSRDKFSKFSIDFLSEFWWKFRQHFIKIWWINSSIHHFWWWTAIHQHRRVQENWITPRTPSMSETAFSASGPK